MSEEDDLSHCLRRINLTEEGWYLYLVGSPGKNVFKYGITCKPIKYKISHLKTKNYASCVDFPIENLSLLWTSKSMSETSARDIELLFFGMHQNRIDAIWWKGSRRYEIISGNLEQITNEAEQFIEFYDPTSIRCWSPLKENGYHEFAMWHIFEEKDCPNVTHIRKGKEDIPAIDIAVIHNSHNFEHRYSVWGSNRQISNVFELAGEKRGSRGDWYIVKMNWRKFTDAFATINQSPIHSRYATGLRYMESSTFSKHMPSTPVASKILDLDEDEFKLF